MRISSRTTKRVSVTMTSSTTGITRVSPSCQGCGAVSTGRSTGTRSIVTSSRAASTDSSTGSVSACLRTRMRPDSTAWTRASSVSSCTGIAIRSTSRGSDCSVITELLLNPNACCRDAQRPESVPSPVTRRSTLVVNVLPHSLTATRVERRYCASDVLTTGNGAASHRLVFDVDFLAADGAADRLGALHRLLADLDLFCDPRPLLDVDLLAADRHLDRALGERVGVRRARAVDGPARHVHALFGDRDVQRPLLGDDVLLDADLPPLDRPLGGREFFLVHWDADRFPLGVPVGRAVISGRRL